MVLILPAPRRSPENREGSGAGEGTQIKLSFVRPYFAVSLLPAQPYVALTMNYRRALVLGAVAIGSLLLIGPLTAGVLIGAIQMLAYLAGGGLVGGQYVALVLVSAIIGIKVAGEVAMIRINGYKVLQRGSSNRIVMRYLLLGLPILASLALIGRFLVMMVGWGLEDEPIILGLVSLVVLALGWAALRTVQAYRQARNLAA